MHTVAAREARAVYPPDELEVHFELPVARGWQRGAAVRLEVDAISWHTQLLRMVAHGAVVFWARRHEAYAEYCRALLCGSPPAHTTALPPLRASQIDAIREPPGEPAWWRAWMHAFVALLRARERPPVLPGLYALRAWPARAARLGGTAFVSGPHAAGLHRTRVLSADGQSRVALYRKRARDGTLPPALALDTGVGQWVLIDGHDRILAATLEGLCPRLVTLRAMGRGGGRRVMGSGAFGLTGEGATYAFARATALQGGRARWKREVRDRLWSLRGDRALELDERVMFAGLSEVVPA